MEELIRKIDGRLEDLENSHKMTVRELGDVKKNVEEIKKSVEKLSENVVNLQASSKQSLEATVELRGTFASIAKMFTDHEARITALEKKQAS